MIRCDELSPPKFIEVLLIALKSPLVTGEVVVKVLGEVKAQAREVLLSLIVENERPILLALALVALPVSDLTLPGAVASDETLAAALPYVTYVGAPFVVTHARKRCRRTGFRMKLEIVGVRGRIE